MNSYSKALKKRWAEIPKEERTKKMRALALKKHETMTDSQKKKQIKRMVEGRLKKNK